MNNQTTVNDIKFNAMFQLFCFELLSAVSFLSFIVKGRIFLLTVNYLS